MKGSGEHYNKYALQHIYQRAEDRGVIFYSIEDRLVYYTLSACMAKRHNIRVAAAAIMFTHTHQSIVAQSLPQIRAYLHDTNSSFARMYNNRYGRTGRLFDKSPGRSQKYSSKEQRTNLIYVFNNHVEKHLCHSASEERWDFLPYFIKQNPFSKPIDRKKMSKGLRRFTKLVDRRADRGHPLDYYDLERVFAILPAYETEQFIDYVISQYKWIDYSYALSLFKDLESMIRAIDSSTGSEYSIKEEFIKYDDTQYSKLIEHADSHNFLHSIHSMPELQKTRYANNLFRNYGFAALIISKFFHIPHK